MKRFFPLVTSLLVGSAVQSAPYCEQLLKSEDLPKKYAKVAPVYSDVSSGWIFTRDQLKDRYDMKASSRHLVQAIVDEFAKRDVPLAIVVAPPRPIIAGQDTLDAAMGERLYSVADAQLSFDKLVEGLSGTGAIVPNLSNAAVADPNIRENFYFQRDTHWTTTGAAVSAFVLAKNVNDRRPDLFHDDGKVEFGALTSSGEIQEKGSLADLVRKTCGTALPPETAEVFDLSRNGSLLEISTDEPTIALLGSSFSNRYKRDHYRFADALALAFDAEVENFSISGGGPIGAIEAYVLSGALDRKDHALVVWELPYTESFNSQSFLRQLLGTLRKSSSPSKMTEVERKGEKTLVRLANGAGIEGVEIRSEELSLQSFNLEVRFDNGSTSKVYLGRRKSVPVDMRTDTLASSFLHFGNATPVEILVTPVRGAGIRHISLF